MTKTYSSWTLAVAAAVGVCALAGCNQRESANETAKDVAEERQDARENVQEERREAADVATEGQEDRAAAEYDVAVAQADGERKVVLTYLSGPWPGIYTFSAGRLKVVDRVAQPEQPKPARKRGKSPRPATAQR